MAIQAALIYIFSFGVLLAKDSVWRQAKASFSLFDDDAQHSQLGDAIPCLNKDGFKTSFYPVQA
ncbi:MAG: hypothetical protein ACJARN_002233 [Arenicella sp.]